MPLVDYLCTSKGILEILLAVDGLTDLRLLLRSYCCLLRLQESL